MQLSDELLKRCRAVLGQCDEFQTEPNLRALIQVSDLRIYEAKLPETTAKDDRVNQTIAYFLKQTLADGRNGFVVLLETLREKYDPGDALRGDFEGILGDLLKHSHQPRRVRIPVLIITMFKEDVEKLANETIFPGPDDLRDLDRFRSLASALDHDQILDWQSLYDSELDQWCPFPGGKIKDMLNASEQAINELGRSRNSTFAYEFMVLSKEFFDATQRVELISRLEDTGGIVILDAVALFHPTIRGLLLMSGVLSKNKIAILVVTPANVSNHHVPSVIDKELANWEHFAAEYKNNLSHLHEIGFGDECYIKRWLARALPAVAHSIQEAQLRRNTMGMQDRHRSNWPENNPRWSTVDQI